MRGLERRLDAGLPPDVCSVASVFVSRWDKAVMGKVPEDLRGQLGIAVAKQTYRSYRELLDSPRWERLENAGARPQRLLWASTGTKDPEASDVLYIEALAAPHTVNTMPEETLHAFADHGEVRPTLSRDGGDAEQMLARFAKAGIDHDALAAQLQKEGAEAFVKSWKELLGVIADEERERSRRRADRGDAGPMATPVTERPAWKALEAHHARSVTCTCGRSSPTIPDAARASRVEAVRALSSTTRSTGSPTRPLRLLARAGRGVRPARAHRRHVPRREDQRHRGPRRPARGAARAAGRAHRRRRRGRRARGARRARPHGGLRRPRRGAARGPATPASASAT